MEKEKNILKIIILNLMVNIYMYMKWKKIIYDYNNNYLFEIKNGKGKGKEYDFYGKLNYEGEYLNGERNDNGKEFNDKNRIVFKVNI